MCGSGHVHARADKLVKLDMQREWHAMQAGAVTFVQMLAQHAADAAASHQMNAESKAGINHSL